MQEINGLRQIGELPAEGFESLYNNRIGFSGAEIYESHHEIYGGTEQDPSYVVFIHCIVDEFDTEMVQNISKDDDDSITFTTAADFPYQVHWVLGEFFGSDSNDEIARQANDLWKTPTVAVFHLYCPDPETFEIEIIWALRFTREGYLALPEHPSREDLKLFIDRGDAKNDADVDRLIEAFGEED